MSDQVVVLDESHMLEKIMKLPEQFEKAWTSLWIKNLGLTESDFDKVLIVGMGGSGIAGELARELYLDSAKPITVWHDYQLPGWVDEKTLAIFLSFSGETEETLDSLKAAIDKKAKVIGISKGGKMAEQAKISGFPHYPIEYDGQPREALGWLYGTLLTLLAKLKVINLAEANYFQALSELKKTTDGKVFPEKAEQLAMVLSNKVPLVIAYPPLSSCARRWVTQFNENSKTFALNAPMPELCHNTVVGLDFPIPEKLVVLFLRSANGFSRNIAREKVITKLFQSKDVPFTPLSIRSGSPLAEQLLFIHFGDLLSYYLAGVYGIDPTPVEAIDSLKEELKKI